MSPEDEALARDLDRFNDLMLHSVRLCADGNEHASRQARRNARDLLARHGKRGAALLRGQGDTSPA